MRIAIKTIEMLNTLLNAAEQEGGIEGGVIVSPTALNKAINPNAVGPFWDKDAIQEGVAWCESEGLPLLPLAISVADDAPMQNREITKMAKAASVLAPAALRDFWKAEVARIESMDSNAIQEARKKLQDMEDIASASKRTTGRSNSAGDRARNSRNALRIDIPSSRKNIPQSTRRYTFNEDAETARKFKRRFEKLQRLPEYQQILDLYRWYIFETVPAPADTAGALWVVTAFPSTSGSYRLGAITCQNVETLVLNNADRSGFPPISGYVNALPADGVSYPDLGAYWTNVYASLGRCLRYEASTLDELQMLLRYEEVLDCCYRLNTELIRKGGSMMERYNNPYLTEAILEAGPLKQSYLPVL